MRPLRVVAVSGGLQRSSKSTVLAEHLLALVAHALPCETRVITVGELAPQLAGAMWRAQLPSAAAQALAGRKTPRCAHGINRPLWHVAISNFFERNSDV